MKRSISTAMSLLSRAMSGKALSQRSTKMLLNRSKLSPYTLNSYCRNIMGGAKRFSTNLNAVSSVEGQDPYNESNTKPELTAKEEIDRENAILELKFSKRYRLLLNRIMNSLADEHEEFAGKARSKYIDLTLWGSFLNHTRRGLIKQPLSVFNKEEILELALEFENILDESPEYLHTEGRRGAEVSPKLKVCRQKLFKKLLVKCEEDHKIDIKVHKTLCLSTDFRSPHEYYAYARLMKRKFIYHGGPTNSGKTYHALKRLAAADPERGGGMYAGPLRLLALEVYEQLNMQGVWTSLVTGQEKRELPGASHIACTLEMVDLHKDYDVAVVDEIQMVGDQQRGYAWTRAIQGIRAKEIHLCGGLESYEIVKNIIESMGDEFELKKYDRLSTLKIAEESLEGDYGKIQPGDCIVAFSRADIFSIKKEVEKKTPYKCCTVYGQLPPETRSTQARLFNEDGTGYDVLVASDAIGMGLNLNIRRIVLHTTVKRGKNGGYIHPSSIKQIAGRAGRLSSKYDYGEVTAWQNADLAYIKAVMQWDIPQIKRVGLFPALEQVQEFSDRIQALTRKEGGLTEEENIADLQSLDTKDIQLSHVINKYVDAAMMDGRYFMCDYEAMVTVSNWLHAIPLSLPERFVFANAPCNLRESLNMKMLYTFAATYAMKRPVALNVRLPIRRPRNVFEFMDLCAKNSILDLYLWLSFRFPTYFIERDLCLEQRNYALNLIEQSLALSELHQDFDHADDYREIREDFIEKNYDMLPPESWGAVRETMKEELKNLDNKDLKPFVYLNKSRGQRMKYGKSSGNSSSYKRTDNRRASMSDKKDSPRKSTAKDDGGRGVAYSRDMVKRVNRRGDQSKKSTEVVKNNKNAGKWGYKQKTTRTDKRNNRTIEGAAKGRENNERKHKGRRQRKDNATRSNFRNKSDGSRGENDRSTN